MPNNRRPIWLLLLMILYSFLLWTAQASFQASLLPCPQRNYNYNCYYSIRDCVVVALKGGKRRRRRRRSIESSRDNKVIKHNENKDDDDNNMNFAVDSNTQPPPPNRRERMQLILQRDGEYCVWCRSPLTLYTATTDHVIPRIKGGPSWIENEVASCARCNKFRGHTRPFEFLDMCQEQKGWTPNRNVIAKALQSLDTAIAQRGGQRKARPYLARELRQLRK